MLQENSPPVELCQVTGERCLSQWVLIHETADHKDLLEALFMVLLAGDGAHEYC